MECPNSKTTMKEKYVAQIKPGVYEREYECPKDGEIVKTIEMPQGQYEYLLRTTNANARSRSRWRRTSILIILGTLTIFYLLLA